VNPSLAADDQAFSTSRSQRASHVLGYREAWTVCGEGSFLWMKLSSKPS
jgi:hypothetical protein